MRRFADTLPTLRGGDVPRADANDEGTAFLPLLAARSAQGRPPSAPERSRRAQAEILERTAARFDRQPTSPPDPRRAAIPSLADDGEDAIAARIAAAVAEATAAAAQERHRAVAAAREDAERAAEAALADARARWAAAEGTALADSLARRLDALEASLVASLSRAVGPLVETAVHERALARFRDILAGLLSGPRRAAIVVKGPEDLLDAFRAVWGERQGVRCEVAERAELVADVGPTRIETALAPFRAALAEALAAPAPTPSKDRQNVQ
jgi:hypothetical protein